MKPISNQWVASVTADLSSAYQRCNEAWRAILDYQAEADKRDGYSATKFARVAETVIRQD